MLGPSFVPRKENESRCSLFYVDVRGGSYVVVECRRIFRPTHGYGAYYRTDSGRWRWSTFENFQVLQSAGNRFSATREGAIRRFVEVIEAIAAHNCKRLDPEGWEHATEQGRVKCVRLWAAKQGVEVEQ